MAERDAHARPPDELREFYKRYQKLSQHMLIQDTSILDCARISQTRLYTLGTISVAGFAHALGLTEYQVDGGHAKQAYGHPDLPGLHIVPNFMDQLVQRALLDRLLHRDLADARHQTNIHKHWRIPYEVCAGRRKGYAGEPVEADDMPDVSTPRSFFACVPNSDVVFPPLDATIHKPISISQFLNRKLRWMTLGGQYDWTRKVYPDNAPHPEFPQDIAQAVESAFPNIQAQAAICNVYSPSDTLSLHRDVSEEVEAGLVSLSMGCDALFVICVEDEQGLGRPVCMRLHSGDAVYMSGPARHAWHGLPQVLTGTCPEELASWPAANLSRSSSAEQWQPKEAGMTLASELEAEGGVGAKGAFDDWRDWLRNKRINLNVRQMYA